jgi:NAD(P) transhydrogenase
VVIQEVGMEDWGAGGLPVGEYRRQAGPDQLVNQSDVTFPTAGVTLAEHGSGKLEIVTDEWMVFVNGIYTIPEVAMVGETEESLRQQGVDHVVGRASYLDNGRGRIIGDSDGFLKLLFRREDMKLLGVHVLGEQATEVVHIGLMAMLAGATA